MGAIANAIALANAAIPAEMKSTVTFRRVSGALGYNADNSPRLGDGAYATITGGADVSAILTDLTEATAVKEWGADTKVTVNCIVITDSTGAPALRRGDGVIVTAGIGAGVTYTIVDLKPVDAAGVVFAGLRLSRQRFA